MKRFTTLTFFLSFLAVFILAPASGEDISATELRYSGSSIYYFVERSNWSTYINGKYIGLMHRETRANLSRVPETGANSAYNGHFYILEETLKDMTRSARGLDGIVKAAFSVSPDGTMKFTVDNGYPQLRGFPAYPENPVHIGDSWQAAGFRVVDPRNDGKKSVLPLLADYRFVGSETWRGIPVYRIQARYANRISVEANRKLIDPDLRSASGSHQLDILVSSETGAAIMMLDKLDETFTYADGGTVRFKGSTAFFTDAPVPVNSEKLLPKIAEIIAESDTKAPGAANIPEESTESTPFVVEKTDQGVRLSVRNLRFLPDSDELIADEEKRLDKMARTLALVPGGRFLVEGHTAAIGKTAGELELSIKRAIKIVEEMTKRGLAAEQFMYAGYGGTRPVASNDTEEGRAQNRRVEITILE